MRAAVCREFGVLLAVEHVRLAPPGPGEIRVRVAACAVCHSDITYMEGGWGGELPAVYGHEAAGVVLEAGPGVAEVAPGDHVVVTLIRSCGACRQCARGQEVLCEGRFRLDEEGPIRAADGSSIQQAMRTGAFAEQVTVHASQAVAIPKDVPLDSAALLACGAITGVGAVLNTARMPAGADVVVVGTGGVGLNSVQGAALCGARAIVAVDLSDSKLAAARRFGATHALNPAREHVAAAVRALTGGRGAEYVFVTVGVKSAIEQAFGLLARGGAVVVVGMPASGVMAAFDPTRLADSGQRVLGSKMGSARIRVDVPMLVDLYRQGRLKLDELISGRYPLEEINAAVASAKRGEALRNVVVF
ncbi:MAG TPA: Zn-dependent alcohol dehydrogenase [Geminicoccaceae bacterium]|nr:Zn-dependent alcohol dehydrogenase [Geminicoccaceae bacterium]